MHLVPQFSTKDTLQPMWQRACWSLNLAFHGTRPQRSLDNYPISQRALAMPEKLSARFCCTEIKGDWKWIVEQFELFGHYWKSVKICHKCPACRIPSKGPIFTDFTRSWPLRSTTEFVRECLPIRKNPLIHLEGFHVDLLNLGLQWQFPLGLAPSKYGAFCYYRTRGDFFFRTQSQCKFGRLQHV